MNKIYFIVSFFHSLRDRSRPLQFSTTYSWSTILENQTFLTNRLGGKEHPIFEEKTMYFYNITYYQVNSFLASHRKNSWEPRIIRYWSGKFFSRTYNIFQLHFKVHIFWEGHKILRNLHRRFVLCSANQIYGGDFANWCDLLKIYEL